MNNPIRERLENLADEKYRTFAASLLPGCEYILGVRLPLLRKLAKDIAKGDWRYYADTTPTVWFEEIMLLGMVTGYAKADVEEKLTRAKGFVPLITNWSLCDSFCTGLTFTRDNKDRVWEFLQPFLESGEEYAVRFAVVMLLTYYIDNEFIDRVFIRLNAIKHDGYYVKMAVAWAVSICFIKFPERTTAYLSTCHLDDFTFNKSLQKITESFRVDKATKEIIRKMKR